MISLINWSEVSRLLTNDRTAIRHDYKGKKYKEVIHAIKGCETEIKAIIKQHNYEINKKFELFCHNVKFSCL